MCEEIELPFSIPWLKFCYLSTFIYILHFIQKPWISPSWIYRVKHVISLLTIYTFLFTILELQSLPELKQLFWKGGEFLMQVLLGTLTSSLIMRWRHPTVLDIVVKPGHASQRIGCRALGSLTILLGILAATFCTEEEILQHVKGTISWGFPIIGFLIYGGGVFVLKRKLSTIVAIVVTTLALSFVEWKTTKIDEQASFASAWSLPLKGVYYFSVLNTIIVLSLCGLEKSFEIIKISPNGILQAFLMDEARLPQKELVELETAIGLMRHGTKSFWMASFFYSEGSSFS